MHVVCVCAAVIKIFAPDINFPSTHCLHQSNHQLEMARTDLDTRPVKLNVYIIISRKYENLQGCFTVLLDEVNVL